MNSKVDLLVDASPVGVGALLVQEGKIVNYASKALNDVEMRYTQIERESLAILYAIENLTYSVEWGEYPHREIGGEYPHRP